MIKKFVFGILATVFCLHISVSVDATELDVSNNDTSTLVYEEQAVEATAGCEHVFSEGVVTNTTVMEEEITFTCEKCGQEYIYEYLPGKTICLTRFRANPSVSHVSSFTFPSTINGAPVKQIGIDDFTNFFPESFRIDEIIIPDTVKFISDRFYPTSVQKVIIKGTSMGKIGYAFTDCEKLQEISIPSSVKEIGLISFSQCKELKEISLPSGLEKIGEAAFSGCESIKEISIPENVNEIPEKCFWGCSELENIELKEGIQTIGYEAFFNCYSLKEITIPASVKSIGVRAFGYCRNKITAKEELLDGFVCYGYTNSPAEKYCKKNGITFISIGKVDSPMDYVEGELLASFQGYSFMKDENGSIRCYNEENGEPIINEFKCDGTYTYYFQADGTAMKDRLTYHPDGVHVIYFDEAGHEVFSNFHHVSKAINGDAVDDYCFFDVYGYLYVDVLTYDQSGYYLLYANPYGRLECYGWFQFSDTVKWADGTPCVGIAGGYGYGQSNGYLLTNTWTNDWNGNACYLQGNGVAKY